MKRKVIISFALLLLLLSACNMEITTTEAKSVTPKVIEANLEDIPYPYEGYVIDKRTSCLHTANWGDRQNYLMAVVGANGEVVGCRENPNAQTVEQYFK